MVEDDDDEQESIKVSAWNPTSTASPLTRFRRSRNSQKCSSFGVSPGLALPTRPYSIFPQGTRLS